MKILWPRRAVLLALIAFSTVMTSCEDEGKEPEEEVVEGPCANPSSKPVAGSTGSARIFSPDPASSSGDLSLPPTATNLDDYALIAELDRLDGHGVLRGTYVDIRNRLQCNDGYGVFSANNQFVYSQAHHGFQEAMNYYHGDRYRAYLDDVGYLTSSSPLKIVTHCMLADNAYYMRGTTLTGEVIEEVCMGNSFDTPGASYSDDAMVSIHEIQHGSTINTYSEQIYLNQFWYDEAGALNEAISDFMALIFVAPSVHSSLNAKLFSRWALKTFISGHNGARGAHRCPSFDPDYPDCNNYVQGYLGFSADQNQVGFSYPDGMGWPHANNYSGPGYLRSIYLSYRGQEEIHVTGLVVVGALWDAYERLVENYGGDTIRARDLMGALVHEVISHLPKPNLFGRLSPVSFRGFAQLLVDWAAAVGFSSADQSDLSTALTERGLLGGPSLPVGWAQVGTGHTATPGMRVLDSPTTLAGWLGGPLEWMVEQGFGNSKPNPGDLTVVWFDIQNNDETTAGSLYLTVTLEEGSAEFLDDTFNPGIVHNEQAQIIYSKVNGTGIVDQLSSTNQNFHVPTANTYFKTNPYYNDLWRTGIWMKVLDSATSGELLKFKVEIEPENGEKVTLNYEVPVD